MKKFSFEYIVEFRKDMIMEIFANSEDEARVKFDKENPMNGDYIGWIWDDLDVTNLSVTEDESYDDWEDEIDHEEEE